MAQQVSQQEKKRRKRTKEELAPSIQDENKSRHAVTILKPVEEVFAFWRSFQNLPLFMKDVHRVDVLSSKASHWVVKLKNGATAEWDAQIIHEIPNRLISWASLAGSEVTTSGTVWFEPDLQEEATIVQLSMDFSVPGGKLTELITMFTGESPDILIMTNLKRLKAVLETGEYPTVEGQPSGRSEDGGEDNKEIKTKQSKH